MEVVQTLVYLRALLRLKHADIVEAIGQQIASAPKHPYRKRKHGAEDTPGRPRLDQGINQCSDHRPTSLAFCIDLHIDCPMQKAAAHDAASRYEQSPYLP